MYPNVRKLANEARSAGAVPVLYQTWGRRDGDGYYSSRDDFHAMNRRLREGYRQAARTAGGLTVVPVGDAWEREVDAGNAASLFMPDGSHPTPYAERMVAETFYRTLFLETSSSRL
jgi:lysophospholipase L1-like esterase